MILYNPISRLWYFGLPMISAFAGGAGAGLIMIGAGAPDKGVIGFSGGIAIVSGLTGLWVAIEVVGRERERYLQFLIERTKNFGTKEEQAPEIQEDDGYREVKLANGLRGWVRSATPRRYRDRFEASEETVLRVSLEREDPDEDEDQTTLIDISWASWTIARNYPRIRTFAEEGWKGVFESTLHYRSARDELIRRKILAWKNPKAHKAGVEPTLSGAHILESLARLDKPPSSPILIRTGGRDPGAYART
jgi:hypothetical protein